MASALGPCHFVIFGATGHLATTNAWRDDA